MIENQGRRESILAAAATICAERGVRATTVRAIADAVGVLSGSLYHHFPSKNAMVEEILLRYLTSLRTAYEAVLDAPQSAAGLLREIVMRSLIVAEENEGAVLIFRNEGRFLREQPQFAKVFAVAGDLHSIWLQVAERGVAEGTFRGDIPPEVVSQLMQDAVQTCSTWHRSSDGYSTARLADDITSLFLVGYSASELHDRVAQHESQTSLAV